MFQLPWSQITEAEEHARYPPWLKLQHLQIVHRHGPRTPLNYRLPEFYPFVWPLCARSNAHVHVSSNGPRVMIAGNESDEFGHVSDTKIAIPHTPHSNCLLGQLTDVGMSAMEELGGHLRQLYIASGRLTIDPHHIQLRSTNYPRTIQSVHAVFRGLFPVEEAAMQERGEPVTVHVKDSLMENMESTSRCGRYKQLLRHFDRVVADRLDAESKTLRQSFPHLFASKDLFGRQHSIYGIYETLTSYIAHGLPTPHGVDPELMQRLEAYVSQELYTIFKESQEAVKFSVGRFLKELVGNVERPDIESQPRLNIYSAHDTTLAPLLAALDHQVDKNPPYCSTIAIEVATDARERSWYRRAPSDSRYVRVLYNNTPVILPQCAQPGNHHTAFSDGSLCKLGTFAAALRQFMPKDFLMECAADDPSLHEDVIFR
jgi:acid phosphatase